MNVATHTTIETILNDTRPEDVADYREWGRRAGTLLSQYPEQAADVLIDAMTARARGRIAREADRSRDGLARVVVDSISGQMTAWDTWTDATALRETGKRLVREGDKKLKLGQKMQQAADCLDAHPGLTARDAWVAEGLDPAELDAASEEAA